MIFKIFQLLGTPNEMTWPGVSALPDFKPNFPKWPRQLLTKKCPALDPEGLDLLKVRIRCSRIISVNWSNFSFYLCVVLF